LCKAIRLLISKDRAMNEQKLKETIAHLEAAAAHIAGGLKVAEGASEAEYLFPPLLQSGNAIQDAILKLKERLED
jgi:hypothetical protein